MLIFSMPWFLRNLKIRVKWWRDQKFFVTIKLCIDFLKNHGIEISITIADIYAALLIIIWIRESPPSHFLLSHPCDPGVWSRDGNGAGIPRPRRGPTPKRGKFPAPVGERGGGGGGGIFPRPRPASLPSLVWRGRNSKGLQGSWTFVNRIIRWLITIFEECPLITITPIHSHLLTKKKRKPEKNQQFDTIKSTCISCALNARTHDTRGATIERKISMIVNMPTSTLRKNILKKGGYIFHEYHHHHHGDDDIPFPCVVPQLNKGTKQKIIKK